MSEPIDDHTLNACLARGIGLKIITGYCEGSEVWVFHRNGEPDVWSPLTNPAQIEEVEVWLRENGYEFGWAWSKSDGYYTAHVLLDPNPTGDPKILYRTAVATDKKRAFALAVWGMEQPQKGGKGE